LGAVYDPARISGAAAKFLNAVKAATPRGNQSH
jgi:hypothetical protein